MGPETRPLHVLFLPLMNQGHLIPMIDSAKLFALREGVQVSIVTTPRNAARIQPTIDRTNSLSVHHPITIYLLQFPSIDAGLPIGSENFESFTPEQTAIAYAKALPLLHHPFEELAERLRPDCIVSDMFFPWTVDVAAKLDVPRLAFIGTGFFILSVDDSIERYAPHESVATETDPFLVPNLPHPIKMTKSQLPDFRKADTSFSEIMKRALESIKLGYGVFMNSFYELEPDYVKHYKEQVIRRNKAWHIGPVSVSNIDQMDMAERGKKSIIDPNQCLDWLDSREHDSVLYVCFGSLGHLCGAQLVEIALALEASGRSFIWVVRNTDRMEEKWMPDGFEERMRGKGLIIRGWAPQLMILNHPAVGGFVTHVGWGSVLESVTAGVPMATWPLTADQFYNERQITYVLKIGVEVGAQVWSTSEGGEGLPLIKCGAIERAVAQLMDGGDEANERRRRVRELGEMAKRAVEKGGSSYMDLDRLIQELKDVQKHKQRHEG